MSFIRERKTLSFGSDGKDLEFGILLAEFDQKNVTLQFRGLG